MSTRVKVLKGSKAAGSVLPNPWLATFSQAGPQTKLTLTSCTIKQVLHPPINATVNSSILAP